MWRLPLPYLVCNTYILLDFSYKRTNQSNLKRERNPLSDFSLLNTLMNTIPIHTNSTQIRQLRKHVTVEGEWALSGSKRISAGQWWKVHMFQCHHKLCWNLWSGHRGTPKIGWKQLFDWKQIAEIPIWENSVLDIFSCSHCCLKQSLQRWNTICCCFKFGSYYSI